MNDPDFDKLRLGFNKSHKRTKTNQPKISMGDPKDVDEYVGPWGSILSDNVKASCGPSEVETLFYQTFLKAF